MAEKLTKTIIAIADEVRDAKHNAVPVVLLKLQRLLKPDANLSLDIQALVKLQLLETGLTKALVDAVAQDYLKVSNDWTTASQIATLAVQSCVNHPDWRSKAVQECLALLSNNILILLGNIHYQCRFIESKGAKSDSYRAVFGKVCGDLLFLAATHKGTTRQVLESHKKCDKLFNYSVQELEYMLLSTAAKLARMDQDSVRGMASADVLAWTDVCARRIVNHTTALQVVRSSVELIVSFLNARPLMIEQLRSRYKELKDTLERNKELANNSFVNTLLDYFTSESLDEIELLQAHQQAARIQAAWRGYRTRQSLAKAKAGVVQLQRLFRSKRVEQLNAKSKITKLRENEHRLILNNIQLHRRNEERKLAIISCLPARAVDLYLEKEMQDSATTVQALWKGYQTRKQVSVLKVTHEKDTAARIIQRTMRQYTEKRKRQVMRLSDWPGLTEQRREELQILIDDQKDKRMHSVVPSQTAQKLLHDQVQGMLKFHYARRPGQLIAYQKRNALIAQLEMAFDILEGAPILETLTTRDLRVFQSHRRAAAAKATELHKIAMRNLNAPKWKRLLDDDEDDSVQLFTLHNYENRFYI